MGIISRLLGREEAAPPPSAFDCEAVRPHLNSLIDSLGLLAEAMDHDGAPLSNPGWRGRLRDLRDARGDLRLLTRKATFDKDDLFEVLSTIRPLYRGEPPKDFAHLAELNTAVVDEIEAVHLASR